MKKCHTLFILLTLILTAFAANAADFAAAEKIYSYAKVGNTTALKMLKDIDVADNNGNTALCLALINHDRNAYDILQTAGASSKAECVGKIGLASGDVDMDNVLADPKSPYSKYSPGAEKSSSFLGMSMTGWAAVGIVVAGGTVAALASGKDGSGKVDPPVENKCIKDGYSKAEEVTCEVEKQYKKTCPYSEEYAKCANRTNKIHCSSYSNTADVCTSCQAGWTTVEGKCSKCDTAGGYAGNGSKCTNCTAEGLIPSADGLTCVKDESGTSNMCTEQGYVRNSSECNPGFEIDTSQYCTYENKRYYKCVEIIEEIPACGAHVYSEVGEGKICESGKKCKKYDGDIVYECEKCAGKYKSSCSDGTYKTDNSCWQGDSQRFFCEFCETSIKNCSLCSSSDYCYACKNGFIPSTDGKSCMCPEKSHHLSEGVCLENNDTYCSTQGKKLTDMHCKIGGTLTCVAGNTDYYVGCSLCNDGYSFDANLGICIKKIDPCTTENTYEASEIGSNKACVKGKECKKPDGTIVYECTECASNYHEEACDGDKGWETDGYCYTTTQTKQKCKAIPCDEKYNTQLLCGEGEYEIDECWTGGKQMLECGLCSSINEHCTTCSDGETCNTCTVGWSVASNCTKCDKDKGWAGNGTNCQNCWAQNQVVSEDGLRCEEPAAACSESTKPGAWCANSICVADNEWKCTSCSEDAPYSTQYHMNAGECVVNDQNYCSAVLGYKTLGTMLCAVGEGGVCQPGPGGTTFYESCKTCSDPNYEYEGGICEPKSEDTPTLPECGAYTYDVQPSVDICANSSACQTNGGGTAYECTECASKYNTVGDTCGTGKYKVDASGFCMLKDGTQKIECGNCSTNCTTCSDSDTCTACGNGFQLIGNACECPSETHEIVDNQCVEKIPESEVINPEGTVIDNTAAQTHDDHIDGMYSDGKPVINNGMITLSDNTNETNGIHVENTYAINNGTITLSGNASYANGMYGSDLTNNQEASIILQTNEGYTYGMIGSKSINLGTILLGNADGETDKGNLGGYAYGMYTSVDSASLVNGNEVGAEAKIILRGNKGYAYGMRGSGKITNYQGASIILQKNEGYTYGIDLYNVGTATNLGIILLGNDEGEIDKGNLENAYGMYGYNNNATLVNGDASGVEAKIILRGNKGVASGMRSSGNITNYQGASIILQKNDGDFVSGINARTNNITTNSGTITLSGNTGSAYGIYAYGNNITITNSGTIELADNGRSIGIYAEGDGITVTNTETGKIYIKDMTEMTCTENCATGNYGIVAIGDVTLVNDGLISGDALHFGPTSAGGMVMASKTARFEAENEISGDLVMSSDVVADGFNTTYSVDDMIAAGDVRGLNLLSQSALFDAHLENESNAVLEMKAFSDVVEDKSVADFLAQNYAEGNNEGLFSTLKSTASVSELNHNIDDLFGKNMLSRMAFEDFMMIHEVSLDMNNQLFKQEGAFAFGGNVAPSNYDSNTGSVGRYSLNGYNKGKMSFGVGVSITDVRTDDGDNRNSRFDRNFMLSAPIGYKTYGFELITAPKAGYADGEYDRSGLDNRTYKGKVVKRMLALMNEARYPIKFGGVKFVPTAEFNMIGYNIKAHEDDREYSLRIKSQNHYLVEAGLGLAAEREFRLFKDHKFNVSGGVAVYHEFADPYALDVTMRGMSGSYRLRDEKHSDERAALRFGFGYALKDYLDVTANLLTNISREYRTDANFDLRYHF